MVCIKRNKTKPRDMQVCADSVAFVGEGGAKKRCCSVMKMDFNQLQNDPDSSSYLQQQWSSEDLLHAVAGLCSVCLPDMEVEAIYNSLTVKGCQTIVAMATPHDVVEYRSKHGLTITAKHKQASIENGGQSSSPKGEETNPFNDVISGGESSDSEEDCTNENDRWHSGREVFLAAARQRLLLDQTDENSVGPEHRLLGCATFIRLSSKAAIQLILLAVRKSSRSLGIGRHLMQMCKDPETVGHYEALLAFADPKAEKYFCRHGFNDDPILTAQYRGIVDHWENSTLMVYVPPFSSSGLAVGCLKTLTQFQDKYKSWRDTAISGYSSQLGIMERVRHELLLLHTKVQSHEELISELIRQLNESKEEKASLEREFTAYRKHTQKVMCTAVVDNAEKWINRTSKK